MSAPDVTAEQLVEWANRPHAILGFSEVQIWVQELLARVSSLETALQAARNWIEDGSEDAGHLLGRIDNALAARTVTDGSGR